MHNFTKKKKTIWPMPGGFSNYRDTALEIARCVEMTSKTEEVVSYIQRTWGVSGEKVATSYLRVLDTLGIVEIVGASIYPTPDTTLILAGEFEAVVARALIERVWGCDEIIEILRERPLRIAPLRSKLTVELGKTDKQLRYRLRWMEASGLISRHQSRYPEYALTGKYLHLLGIDNT